MPTSVPQGGTAAITPSLYGGRLEVIRAKMKTAASLNLNDTIEDILISLGKAYHIMRPVASKPGLFFYVVLDRNKSNLALARRKVLEVESQLSI